MKNKKGEDLNKKDLTNALVKKACGFDCTEVVEEYVNNEGEITLLKKKVTKKTVPPDTTAIKMLFDLGECDLSKMSDEELKKEKERLLKLLAKKEKGEKGE